MWAVHILASIKSLIHLSHKFQPQFILSGLPSTNLTIIDLFPQPRILHFIQSSNTTDEKNSSLFSSQVIRVKHLSHCLSSKPSIEDIRHVFVE
jgi:hypothetical protein